MKKSQAEPITAKNLEQKFDQGEDVLDYFDVRKPRTITPRSEESAAKTKFAYPTKQMPARRPVVREKPAPYRKK